MNLNLGNIVWLGALGASSPYTFVPTDFANLVAWHKADALALSDGDPVGSWADASGNSNTLTQSGTARPTYKTAIFGAQPVVRFDGSNDFLAYPGDITFGTNDLTVIAVMTAPAATDGMLLGHTSNIQYRVNRSGTQTISKFFGVSDQSSDVFGSDSSVLGVKIWRRNGAAINWRENKTARPNGVQNDGSSHAIDRVGKTSFGGFLTGDIGELVIYNGNFLSNTDCDNLYDGYFKIRYTGLP